MHLVERTGHVWSATIALFHIPLPKTVGNSFCNQIIQSCYSICI
uniref:Uncharacterized protein n=1 Tax=Medicago truncatula TaxID=3880 RepID=B7FG83_MEDTR|nr:unknown [Medicago truncatula]AFK33915.1 unknown [Medicago truncatula]